MSPLSLQKENKIIHFGLTPKCMRLLGHIHGALQLKDMKAHINLHEADLGFNVKRIPTQWRNSKLKSSKLKLST